MALPCFTPCFNLTVSWEMEISEVYQKGKKQKFLSYSMLKISSDINDLEDQKNNRGQKIKKNTKNSVKENMKHNTSK